MDIIEKTPMEVSENLLEKLYNRKTKEKFLQDYLEEDHSRTSYCVFLINGSRWEKKINKDMSNFTREEVMDCCSDNFTDSYSSLRAFYTICTLYSSWSTAEGYNETMINSWKLVKFNQHIMPMLNALHLPTKFLSEEQVWAMEDVGNNYQDFVTIILSYFLVSTNEIQNLTKSDINEITNCVKLTEKDGSVREVELPRRVIDVINTAWGEDIYYRRGKAGFGDRITANLKSSDYICRPTTVNGDDFLSKQSICSRAKKLLVDAGYSNLSIGDVFMSAKLNKLKAIEVEKGKLEVEDFKQVQFEANENVKNYNNLMINYYLVNPKAEE